MSWHRQDNFHNSRVYGDEPTGGGFFGWLNRQFNKLLRSAGDPGPQTILFTHALDDRLSEKAVDRREAQRTAVPYPTPFEDPRQ